MKYSIHESNIERLESKINKMKTKFSKLNAKLTYEVLGEEFMNFGTEDEPIIERFVNVEVNGFAIINGWKIIGKLEKAGIENIITVYDFKEVDRLLSYKHSEIVCEHCHTNARRKYSYILMNVETNEIKQVGTSCITQFTGIDAEQYVKFLSQFEGLAEFEVITQGEQKGHHYVKTADILDTTIQLVDKYGYIKKESVVDGFIEYNEHNTYEAVSRILGLSGKELDGLYNEFELSKEHKEEADKIVEYFSNLSCSTDYEAKLKVVLSSEYTERRNVALVVSSVAAKRRIDKENERVKNLTSEYVGNVGDKISLENCLFEKIASYDSIYGMVFVYKIINGSNSLVWKTSKYIENGVYNIKGTIKAHNEYRKEKQTELTRVKVS